MIKEIIITKKYLLAHPNHIFVFGDNTLREGKGGAAKLRDSRNTYGFITKRYPGREPADYYEVSEYIEIFRKELILLKMYIKKHSDKLFLISKLGAGLANKYGIFEHVIYPKILELDKFKNVKFLFE